MCVLYFGGALGSGKYSASLAYTAQCRPFQVHWRILRIAGQQQQIQQHCYSSSNKSEKQQSRQIWTQSTSNQGLGKGVQYCCSLVVVVLLLVVVICYCCEAVLDESDLAFAQKFENSKLQYAAIKLRI